MKDIDKIVERARKTGKYLMEFLESAPSSDDWTQDQIDSEYKRYLKDPNNYREPKHLRNY